jgi:subtilisin family serine protease
VRVYQFRHIRAEREFYPAGYGPPISQPRVPCADLGRGALLLAAVAALSLLLAPAGQTAARERTEVVVTLQPPGLAEALTQSRMLSARARARRLDLSSPTSEAYLRRLEQAQRAVARRIVRAVPSARVRWRYRIVLDGLAVDLPRDRLHALARIPGVARVWRGEVLQPTLDRSPELIGADLLWGLPDFTTAGNGIKIGIIDDGVDQKHPFFDPVGYTYPAGFPKGNPSYTTPKVIVARAFAPPSTTWKYARVPFDPVYSDHGTHVAGIAAGEYTVNAVPGRGPLAGIAPKAYLGNYKMNSTPFGEEGLIENSAELTAAIEAAVRDGMDVINISYGEPQVDTSRSIVEQAVDAAADAGVVPAISAGNFFDELGRGSIDSPGTAQKAITAAAAGKNDVIAPFSGSGPSPLSLALKPDVSAPAVSILSSVPAREGSWAQFSGTSMAAPMVAGSAALLRQRHPDWTVAQIKSALVLTGGPVYADGGHTEEVPTTREGGGMINLSRADNPLFFAAPTSLSFGLLRAGKSATRSAVLTDAGGGAGLWDVQVHVQQQANDVTVTAPPSVTVPGRLDVRANAAANATELDVTGFVVLSRNADERRIPFWLRVERPRLEPPSSTLVTTGSYKGNTRAKPSRVDSYRYPDGPGGVGLATNLPGPEQVFRVRVRRAIANFGVVVSSSGRGVRVTPRLVVAGDENRLLGYQALPIGNNPYVSSWFRPEPIVGAIRPTRGSYDIVFDTVSAATAGPFTFRFWLDDTTPPSVRLVTKKTRQDGQLHVALSDRGSGVNPSSIAVRVDARSVTPEYDAKTGRLSIPVGSTLTPGRHQLTLQVSDYQEEKNSESVPGVLPNTRFYHASFTVTR